MAETSFIYGKAFVSAFNKEVDLAGGNIKAAIHTSLYVPDQHNEQYWDVDVDNEASGANYTAGGFTVPNPVINVAAGTFTFDCDDIPMPDNGAEGRYLVFYDDGPATNKPLLICVTFDGDKTPRSATVDTNGLISIDYV